MLGLVAIAAGEYPVVVESGDAIMALFETIPRIMLIAFGMIGMDANFHLGVLRKADINFCFNGPFYFLIFFSRKKNIFKKIEV